MLELDILCATARQDGEPLDLPPRELALLSALALGPRVWPSYQLIPLLWPQAHPACSSSLKVYVHRLRRRLGPATIASTNRGYELSTEVHVDLWNAQTRARKPALSETDRLVLARFYAEALRADRSFLNRWDWFGATEDLIKSSLCAIAIRLAQDAVDRNQREEAVTILRSAATLSPPEVLPKVVVPMRRYAPVLRQAAALS